MDTTSKTLVLTGHGGEDKFKVEQRPRATPGKGEVLVNIKANGINFAEICARMGIYDIAPKPPCVLGYEGAGVVVELGEGITDYKVGDRVVCTSSFHLWMEYKVMPLTHIAHMPEGMSFEEGAAIPVNYMTAYFMLFEQGGLREGMKVLVHMAAGGVGIAAIQLCQTVPNVTVFGTASPSKHDIIRKLGCTHPIDYRTKDYVKEIRKISEEGVDLVLDPLAGPDTQKGIDLLKPLGRIIVFGAANMISGEKLNYLNMAYQWWNIKNINPVFTLMPQNKSVSGFHLGYLVNYPDIIKKVLLKLLDLYREGKIKPRIDSVWSYEEIGKAMGQMIERKNIGKVIIKPYKD